MKRLNKIQNVIFTVGAILLILGAILFITHWTYSPYMFFAGAILFSFMQFLQRYDGNNITIKRLRRMQIISDFCILFSGLLMLENYQYVWLKWINYGFYVRNEWIVCLLIGALLQLYAAFRIPSELEKEAKKS